MSNGNGQQNGHNGGPAEMAPKGDRDPVTGRFLKGWKGGPGRPRKFDVAHVARKLAKKEGYDLKGALWEVLKGQIKKAIDDMDTQAARVAFEQLGTPTRQPMVAIQNNNTNAAVMPQAQPEGSELTAWVQEFGRIEAKHLDTAGDQ